MTFSTLELLDDATRLHYIVNDTAGIKSIKLEQIANFNSSAPSSNAETLYEFEEETGDPYDNHPDEITSYTWKNPVNTYTEDEETGEITSEISVEGKTEITDFADILKANPTFSSISFRVNGIWVSGTGNSASFSHTTVNPDLTQHILAFTTYTVDANTGKVIITCDGADNYSYTITGFRIYTSSTEYVSVIPEPQNATAPTTKEGYYDIADTTGMYVLWAENTDSESSFSMTWNKSKIFKAITSVVTGMQRACELVSEELLNFIFKVEIFEKCWEATDYTNAIKIWQKYFVGSNLLKDYIPKCNA